MRLEIALGYVIVGSAPAQIENYTTVAFCYADEPIKVNKFNRVYFGLRSNPFHALCTIKLLTSDVSDSLLKAKETVDIGLYMDDFVYGVDNEEEAIATTSEVIGLFRSYRIRTYERWPIRSCKVDQ